MDSMNISVTPTIFYHPPGPVTTTGGSAAVSSGTILDDLDQGCPVVDLSENTGTDGMLELDDSTLTGQPSYELFEKVERAKREW